MAVWGSSERLAALFSRLFWASLADFIEVCFEDKFINCISSGSRVESVVLKPLYAAVEGCAVVACTCGSVRGVVYGFI